jgi:hypothetical protein
MTGMADEETTGTAATVGNQQGAVETKTENATAEALPVNISEQPTKIEGENSPFFGKIAPQSPPVTLNPGSSIETTPSLKVPPQEISNSFQKNSQAVPQNQPLVRAEDKLHSGNIVSLLEAQERLKQGAPQITPLTGTKYTETPVQRSIREIGLKPRLQQEAPRSSETKTPLSAKPGELPRIRTYAADMSEEIRKRGETLSTIISAERMKMGKGPVGDEIQTKTEIAEQEKNRGTLLSFGAVFLAVVGVVALVLAFVFTRPAPVTPERVTLIPVNYAELVNIGADERAAVGLGELRQDTDLRLGEMKEFVLTQGGVPLQGSEILTTLGAPNVLARNSTNVMVGIHAFDRNQPFLLISVSAYDRAFEGMLEWESTIADSLGTFFAPYRAARDTRPEPPRITFSDRVYQNIDVRESQAEWKILYAFPRRDLLLITTNESTLREVVTRLTLQSGN